MRPLIRTDFASAADWELGWAAPPPTRIPKRGSRFSEVAHFVGGAMMQHGFQLFANGGVPLLLRQSGDLTAEILLLPGKALDRREDAPFAVRIHLSHSGVGRVRSRYWRPASRAPVVIASGDVGQIEPRPTRTIWHACDPVATGQALSRQLFEFTVPYLEVFEDRDELRERLMGRDLPLIDASTTLELLLAEFSLAETRRLLATAPPSLDGFGISPELSGHSVSNDRIAQIVRYYRLG